MHISALEVIVFAVVAGFALFGPKPNFRRQAAQPQQQATKIVPMEVVPEYVSRYAADGSIYAAGRAPSPLKLRAAERPLPAPPVRQFAYANLEGSPLPHELTGRW
jgi:hypothetical protein